MRPPTPTPFHCPDPGLKVKFATFNGEYTGVSVTQTDYGFSFSLGQTLSATQIPASGTWAWIHGWHGGMGWRARQAGLAVCFLLPKPCPS